MFMFNEKEIEDYSSFEEIGFIKILTDRYTILIRDFHIKKLSSIFRFYIYFDLNKFLIGWEKGKSEIEIKLLFVSLRITKIIAGYITLNSVYNMALTSKEIEGLCVRGNFVVGKVKEYEIDEKGNRVIKDFEVSGYSLVNKKL